MASEATGAASWLVAVNPSEAAIRPLCEYICYPTYPGGPEWHTIRRWSVAGNGLPNAKMSATTSLTHAAQMWAKATGGQDLIRELTRELHPDTPDKKGETNA